MIDRAGEEKTSGILIGVRFGVPSGEWKGLDWPLKRGAAMAKFELVRVIVAGPIAPKGEADRGGSAGMSRHGSLGASGELALPEVRVAEVILGEGRGDGLNVFALALSILGEAMGDSAELYPDEELGAGTIGLATRDEE